MGQPYSTYLGGGQGLSGTILPIARPATGLSVVVQDVFFYTNSPDEITGVWQAEFIVGRLLGNTEVWNSTPMSVLTGGSLPWQYHWQGKVVLANLDYMQLQLTGRWDIDVDGVVLTGDDQPYYPYQF